jgi:hypothetical protein
LAYFVEKLWGNTAVYSPDEVTVQQRRLDGELPGTLSQVLDSDFRFRGPVFWPFA